MIPYFELVSFQIGPFTVYVWGLLVALGLLAGTWAAGRLAKERGLDPKVFWDVAGIAAAAGIVGGRLLHVVLYAPAHYLAHPAEIVALWDGGISITGSLIAAALAVFLFLRRRRLDVLHHLDTAFFGLPLGYAIGRVGCFLIHDHPGTLTHFLLGVRYPDGTVRHDLGLYEALSGAGLFAVFLVLRRRQAKPPAYVIAFLLWYGVARFLLDFLRAADARYAGLTPAQYVAALMAVGGAAWAWRQWRARKPTR